MSGEQAPIREHLEAIRDACTPDEPSQYEPPRAVLCKEHAVAALASIKRLEDLAHAHLSGHGDSRDLAFVVLGEVSARPGAGSSLPGAPTSEACPHCDYGLPTACTCPDTTKGTT